MNNTITEKLRILDLEPGGIVPANKMHNNLLKSQNKRLENHNKNKKEYEEIYKKLQIS